MSRVGTPCVWKKPALGFFIKYLSLCASHQIKRIEPALTHERATDPLFYSWCVLLAEPSDMAKFSLDAAHIGELRIMNPKGIETPPGLQEKTL